MRYERIHRGACITVGAPSRRDGQANRGWKPLLPAHVNHAARFVRIPLTYLRSELWFVYRQFEFEVMDTSDSSSPTKTDRVCGKLGFSINGEKRCRT